MDKIKSKLSTLENPVSYTLKMFIPGLKDHSIAILDLVQWVSQPVLDETVDFNH